MDDLRATTGIPTSYARVSCDAGAMMRSALPLSGGTSYRLKLPPNIPAANFWSVTLYEAENASGLANGQPFLSLGSRDKPTQNADSSTELYLGPKAPDGKAGNWLATVPGKLPIIRPCSSNNAPP